MAIVPPGLTAARSRVPRFMNPVLKPYFANLIKTNLLYGFKHIVSPITCQSVLDRAELSKKYPDSKGKLDIIDVFSGYGLFSTMLNYELKPRNHIIMEANKDNKTVWQNRLAFLESTTSNAENFRLYDLDGYSWDSFDKIIKQDKVIEPKTIPYPEIHDELLIVGNLTSSKFGESLFAQWIQCCAFQNWLQRYGRVRMLLFVRESSTLKLLAGPRFPRRKRAALRRDMFTELKLLAITEAPFETGAVTGENFDPNLLVQDQPLVLPTSSVWPAGGDFSVVEVLPRSDLSGVNIDDLDYLCQIFMHRCSFTVEQSLKILAPGALQDLGPLIPPHLLNCTSGMLTRDDMLEIYKVYSNWAFKPSYEETLNFFTDETRSF